jgi:P4 family phage/plasmid primase-like protien
MSNSGAQFIVDVFGPSTTHPVFICSLPNDKQDRDKIKQRCVATRDPQVIEGFIRKWDLPQRSTYFCVNPLKKGTTNRSKGTVAELNGLHLDIDFKSVDATPEQILEALRQCSLPPTKVVASGHGYHAYWLLRQSLPSTPENIDAIEYLLGQLALMFAGDREPAHIAALMRMVGTHNSKHGDNIEVVCVIDNPLARYDVPMLTTWLREAIHPVLTRKVSANGSDGGESNPFLAAAARYGYKPPINVEERLAQMTYQGSGDSAVHQTQLHVSAALINQGMTVDAVVELLLKRTREAVGGIGQSWDWDLEEASIRRMCEGWIKKNPKLADSPQSESGPDPGGTESDEKDDEGSEPEDIVLRLAAKKKTQKVKRTSGTVIAIVSDGVIDEVRRQGMDLLLHGGEMYIYGDGIWTLATDATEQWLRVLIQKGADAIQNNDPKVISGAWKRLTAHPQLYRRDVPWDPRGVIAVGNGTLNLLTCELTPWDPSHFVRRKVAVEYHHGATAPQFLKFIHGAFTNRSEDEASKIVAALQEYFGASMCVSLLGRLQRRGAILHGPSNTGKTEIARFLQRLIGDPIASPSVTDIGSDFGMQELIGARAWIRDDAANEGDNLDPQRYKVIVTGEPLNIKRKYKSAHRVELDIPVLLTVNSLPTARDTSDAIFNRSLIIPMNNVFTKESGLGTRAALNIPKDQKYIADILFDREGPGILNWALHGLDRLFARGCYDLPDMITMAIRDFKEQVNPVAEFCRTMVEKDLESKVERADLLCAFHGWWKEEQGGNARLHGTKWMRPKLLEHCPWVTERMIRGQRYYCGLRLKEEGLELWQKQHKDAAHHGGRGNGGSASDMQKVNQPWLPRDSEEQDNATDAGAGPTLEEFKV